MEPLQLDIFEHSRDAMLRNEAVDALLARDAGRGAAAVEALAREYPEDHLLAACRQLLDRLRLRVATPLAPESALHVLHSTDDVVPTARQAFGAAASAWLAPLWTELAEAITDLPFDPANEALHAAPLLLRAANWAEAGRRVERIPSWRRQPAPLAWKVESQCRVHGMDAAWPLLAELCWMAPQRAAALAARRDQPALNRLLRSFDAEFEADDAATAFAWFPAWALVEEPGLASVMRFADAGAATAPEGAARQVLDLLLLERQGRHAEVIAGRKRLRSLHPLLFERYMRAR